MSRIGLVLCVLVTWSFVSEPARAQTAESPPSLPPAPSYGPLGWSQVYGAPALPAETAQPEAPIEVSFVGRSRGLQFDVVPEASDSPVAVCVERCRVRVRPGRYAIRVTGGPGAAAGQTKLTLSSSGTVHVAARSASAKTTGLVLGIAGSALAGVGLILVAGAAMSGGCYGEDSCPPPQTAAERQREADAERETRNVVYLGLGGIAVGTVLTVTGWRLFARNRHPEVTQAQSASRRRRATASRSGPSFFAAPAPAGWGASAGVRF